MEDTLRYFFSAIFQGIAAILTLGAMFYMNYIDKTRSRISELEKEAHRLYEPGDAKILEIILLTNVIEVMKEHYLKLHEGDERYNYHRQIVKEYEDLTKRQVAIRSIIPYLLLKGIILLLVSSTALFCVGLNDNINSILFFIGLFVLLITFSFLLNLNKVISKSFYTETIKQIKLKNFFTDYNGD